MCIRDRWHPDLLEFLRENPFVDELTLLNHGHRTLDLQGTSIRKLMLDITRDCSTLDELREDYGITVCPIVTVREIIAFLHGREVDGKVYIDDGMKAKMEAYLAEYGAKG